MSATEFVAGTLFGGVAGPLIGHVIAKLSRPLPWKCRCGFHDRYPFKAAGSDAWFYRCHGCREVWPATWNESEWLDAMETFRKLRRR